MYYMLNLFKSAISAEVAGHNITVFLTDPDDCWDAVSKLRSYQAPGPIATTEMALARAAIIKCFPPTSNNLIADRYRNSVDECILETFSNQDNETSFQRYRMGMKLAAPKIVETYFSGAVSTRHIAGIFQKRLGVQGFPAELHDLFEEVETKIIVAFKKLRLV
jgi:hypothetical protein